MMNFDTQISSFKFDDDILKNIIQKIFLVNQAKCESNKNSQKLTREFREKITY